MARLSEADGILVPVAAQVVNVFEREGCKPVVAPSSRRLRTELARLRSTGPSSFANLTRDRDYLQVAGGGGGMLLERHEGETGSHFRAYQSKPVVPFEDGTVLVFGGGEITLDANEWFSLDQVVEAFTHFANDGTWPPYIHWREITHTRVS